MGKKGIIITIIVVILLILGFVLIPKDSTVDGTKNNSSSSNEADGSSDSVYSEYKIGQTVQIKGETFYVIADKQEKVVLITKENIDTINLVQSSNANKISFSDEYYWASEATQYPYNITEAGQPEASHYALRAAYDYGVKIGGVGRLLTYNEAEALFSNHKSLVFGTESENGKLSYWLGTANSNQLIYIIQPNYGIIGGSLNSSFSLRN